MAKRKRQVSFAPGPSHLYPGVQEWYQGALEDGIGSLSHRSARYLEIHTFTVNQLRQLLSVPDDYQVFFVGSATEAMERTIQNCVKTHSYHLVNGSFSLRFAEISKALGKKPQKIEVERGKSFDSHMVKMPAKTELVCITHNETSTGAVMPLETIYSVKSQYPDVLVAVDIVSSAPLHGIDLSKTDVAFFSVQKLFGMPAGLGVMIVSPAAIAKAEKLEKEGSVIGSYHSFTSLVKSAIKNQTPETPNVLSIYVLGKVAADMNRRGIENLHIETDKKLDLLHKTVTKRSKLSHFVTEEHHRSRTVIVVDIEDGNEWLVERLNEEGLHVGKGHGSEFKSRQIRIANFPALSFKDVEELASAIDHYHDSDIKKSR